MTLNVIATLKFFRRKPVDTHAELLVQRGYIEPLTQTVLMFLREDDDSDNPSRIRIQLSASQCELLAGELNAYAKDIREGK